MPSCGIWTVGIAWCVAPFGHGKAPVVIAGWTLRRETSWSVVSFKIGDKQATKRTLRAERQVRPPAAPPTMTQNLWMTAQLFFVQFEKNAVMDSDARIVGRTLQSLSNGHLPMFHFPLRTSFGKDLRGGAEWLSVLGNLVPISMLSLFWHKSQRAATGKKNCGGAYKCGKQEKCTISLDEFFGNSTQGSELPRGNSDAPH